jgi:hypothetical protein
MKKITIILALAFVALAVPSEALIQQASQFEDSYNLGEKITSAFIVSTETPFEGIFKATLDCGKYRLDYYTMPLSFEGTTAVNAPELAVSKYAIGTCAIEAALISNDNVVKEAYNSNTFSISQDFPIKISLNTTRVKPNEDVLVSVAFGTYAPAKGTASLSLDGKSYESSLGKIVLKLPGNKPGKFLMTVHISDAAGNIAENTTQIEVLSVPSRLVVHTDKTELNPKDVMHFFAEVLDQANNTIGAKVQYSLSSSKEKILEGNTETGEAIAFSPGPYTKPGDYKLETQAMQFSETSFIKVLEKTELETSFDGRIANFTNSGNVDFGGIASINATKGSISKMIERGLSLKPGQYYAIDLFRELPRGTYDIVINGQLFSAVNISDERSAIKRVSQGLGTITGAVVGLPGAITLKATGLLMAAITLVAVVVFYMQMHKKKMRKKIF